jgi:hypothetical protein
MQEAARVLARLLYVISQPASHGLKGHTGPSPSLKFDRHVANCHFIRDYSPAIYIPTSRCMGSPLHCVLLSPCLSLHSSTYTSRIAAYPNLEFLVIINPNSGPGAAPWWPNGDYIREIPRLNELPNVTTLGYVRATYCKRDLKDVLEDIQTYAERGRKDAGLRVDGIFVDETVNLYSKEAKGYLDVIDRKVEESIGVTGSRLVSHPIRSQESQYLDQVR